MTREPLDAVNERELRKLVEEGWHLVIVAFEDATLHRNQWHGDWALRIATPDGAEERRLVLHREPNDERRFSTIGPVVGILRKYGVVVVHIPIWTGGRGVNVPPPIRPVPPRGRRLG